MTLLRDAPPLRGGRRLYADPDTTKTYVLSVDAIEEDWYCGCQPSAARLWSTPEGYDVIDYEHDPLCSEVWDDSYWDMIDALEGIAELPGATRRIDVAGTKVRVPEEDICRDCPADLIVRADGMVQAIVHADTCPSSVGGWTPEAAARDYTWHVPTGTPEPFDEPAHEARYLDRLSAAADPEVTE
ncbi:hypothetical protein G352_10297 [Rhodococcus ruber BKS 20-38]|uniref:Uncharacterized protein n=1 Tax=Rhodococcus ruber BKS 20-38 TaxID=1278076 RepID=M2ZYG1_9NOCA|nr:hypothetical protein [Rhodococcus ruber]EME65369.1 hypothetical protein G352_10297 [Rhodococcus ruber BKS 20-38]